MSLPVDHPNAGRLERQPLMPICTLGGNGMSNYRTCWINHNHAGILSPLNTRMPVWRQILHLTLILLVATALLGECQQFEVLKISNISFPTSDSSKWAAHARSTYQRNISEFTVCYRHLIESYNDGLYCPVNIGPWKFAQRTFSPGGGGVEGFTGSIISLWRNVHGGGLGNRSMPIGLWPLITNRYWYF